MIFHPHFNFFQIFVSTVYFTPLSSLDLILTDKLYHNFFRIFYFCCIFWIFSVSWNNLQGSQSFWSYNPLVRISRELVLLNLTHKHEIHKNSKALHFRSSHRRCSVKKGVLKNFANFTGKHPRCSLFSIKL